VNASNVKCLLDYYHLSEENEDLSVIQIDKQQLTHVHFAEPEGRVFPNSKNADKYMDFLIQLHKAGYDRRISIEAYSNNYYGDAKIALELLKKLRNEIKQQKNL
jgi:sugar phosphate isomerase/epimerase